MVTLIKKTTFHNIHIDDFVTGSQAMNDYEDGRVLVDFFSRHNTLEEYMELLNETFKK
jgi:hypothetical protein